jgi:hypothetical protein
MSGSFGLLLARAVKFARDLYEHTWARADVPLVEL